MPISEFILKYAPTTFLIICVLVFLGVMIQALSSIGVLDMLKEGIKMVFGRKKKEQEYIPSKTEDVGADIDEAMNFKNIRPQIQTVSQPIQQPGQGYTYPPQQPNYYNQPAPQPQPISQLAPQVDSEVQLVMNKIRKFLPYFDSVDTAILAAILSELSK